jgi:chaperone modulatory protein CbpM
MGDNNIIVKDVMLLDEDTCLTLSELCHACNIHADWVIELIDEGVIEPVRSGDKWRFSGSHIGRVQVIRNLQRDLNVNLAGAALALELLDEINRLRNRLRILDFD